MEVLTDRPADCRYLEVSSDSASFPSHRVSGLGLLVLLLPLAADPVQEGAQLLGRAAALGGEFTRGDRGLAEVACPSPPHPLVSSSGDVDGYPLSELPPAGLLRHPGLGKAEDHGGELRLQRDPEGEAALPPSPSSITSSASRSEK